MQRGQDAGQQDEYPGQTHRWLARTLRLAARPRGRESRRNEGKNAPRRGAGQSKEGMTDRDAAQAAPLGISLVVPAANILIPVNFGT